MTEAEKLLALAARVEQATGPDRELDADIAKAVLPGEWEKLRLEAGMPCGAPEVLMEAGARDYVKYRRKFWFTTSLDAAMTLRPEGWRILSADFSIDGRVRWMLQGPMRHYVEPDGYECDAPDYVNTFAVTAALALAAACLRARARGEG